MVGTNITRLLHTCYVYPNYGGENFVIEGLDIVSQNMRFLWV